MKLMKSQEAKTLLLLPDQSSREVGAQERGEKRMCDGTEEPDAGPRVQQV